MVISAQLNGVITLANLRGTNHVKVKEFYDKLSRNFDTQQALGEGEQLKRSVRNALKKLLHVKPD